MRNSEDDARQESAAGSYNNRHPTLIQTWITTESKRRARRNDRDYEEVYEEVRQRVFAYGQHIDRLLGGPPRDADESDA